MLAEIEQVSPPSEAVQFRTNHAQLQASLEQAEHEVNLARGSLIPR